ncbi:sensor histidine kinase [Mucilaginibacter rubeus]|uniref:histidine kinase n=1 Tax=Mucilaginibacter rubeus TaxID=2027860 RepID=A0A5C1I1A0_9SPHI|nr:sensor histidine kinase [Mucilaginibacter rubeus]QEM11755.1 sensor histidine kinase [Mucilaginibacter rubeus]
MVIHIKYKFLFFTALLSIAGFLPVKAQVRPDVQEQGLLAALPVSNDTAKIKILLDLAGHLVNNRRTKAEVKKANAYCIQALSLAFKLKDETAKSLVWKELADINQDSEDYRRRLAAEKALKEARKNHDSKLEAAAQLEKAISYSHNTEGITQAEKECSKAINILKATAPGSLLYAKSLRLEGVLHANLAHAELSLKELDLALRIAKNNHVDSLQSYYAAYVVTYQNLRNFKEVFRYSLLALKFAEKYRDTAICFDQYTVLAYYYSRSSNIGKEISYLLKARSNLNAKKNTNYAVYIAAALGHAYNQISQYAEAVKILKEGHRKGSYEEDEYYPDVLAELLNSYLNLKQYDDAWKVYHILKNGTSPPQSNIANFIHNMNHDIGSLTAMTRLTIKTHQLALAKINLELLRNRITTMYPVLENLMPYEYLAFQMDSINGNISGALQHFQLYKKYNDSLTREGNARDISQLQLEYETEKKDEDIALKTRNISLLERQSRLQQQAIKSEAMVKNLSVAGIAMLSLLLVISVNRYRIKQRSLIQISAAHRELGEQKEEINTQNESLKQLLEERDWLLKEIHHRVKNNLQIVISLLNSQLANIKDVAAKNVIRESQLRMHSISLIHQKLYQNDNITLINMGEYVRSLVAHLQDSFGTHSRIDFSIQSTNLSLDVSQAVPLGLILNESITNAIKYAFTDRTVKGRISISMDQDQSVLTVKIADNGKGMPTEIDPKNTSSLGMSLIAGLTRQLKGEVRLYNDQGFHINITIPVDSRYK